MGSSSNLPQPPRFGASQQTGPTSISEWVSFYRWLFSLWRKAANSTDVPQSIALNPSLTRPLAADEIIGAADALVRNPPERSHLEIDAANAEALRIERRTILANDLTALTTRQAAVPRRTIDNLTPLILSWQSPSQQQQKFQVIEDTHANRGNYPADSWPNFLYWETDRHVYYLSVNGNWIFSAGTYEDLLGNIPSDLGLNDAGFLFGATDYFHAYYWNGSSWAFAPGDPGSGYIVAAGSSPPIGGLWQLCDGSGATCATSSGGTAAVTTPKLTGDVFVKGGTPGAQQVATQPTWQSGAITDGTSISPTATENTHTHLLGIFNTNVIETITFNPGGSGATLTDTTTMVSLVGNPTNPGTAHDHAITPDPHSHALSNTNAKLNTPSEANGGLPLRIPLAWYMRR